jgi:hypothetical protein
LSVCRFLAGSWSTTEVAASVYVDSHAMAAVEDMSPSSSVT